MTRDSLFLEILASWIFKIPGNVSKAKCVFANLNGLTQITTRQLPAFLSKLVFQNICEH